MPSAWEMVLRDYLETLSRKAITDAEHRIKFNTGISLEDELNKSINMDFKTVALSSSRVPLMCRSRWGRPTPKIGQVSQATYPASSGPAQLYCHPHTHPQPCPARVVAAA